MKDWRHLKGRKVVVTAAGVEYRGTLVELGETSVVLRAPGGHREIPWARVTRIREEGGGRANTPRRPSILG